MALEVPAVRAQALTLQGDLTVQGDLAQGTEGLAMLAEALAICRQIGDKMGEGAALESLGNTHLALGNLAAAAEGFAAYASVCRAAGLDTEALVADLKLALVAAERGDTALAAKLAGEVASRSLTAKRRYSRAMAHAVAGQAAWRAGKPTEAEAELAEALDLARATDNKLLEAHVRVQRLEAWLALGDLAAGHQELAAAEALTRLSGNAGLLARLGALAAGLALQAGDAERALELATPWLASGNRVAAHYARRVAAGAALALERPDEAIAHGRVAAGIASDWQAPWHISMDHFALMCAHDARGDAANARELANEMLGHPPGVASPYARAGAAHWLTAHGDRAAAAELEHALAVLRPGLAALGHERATALLVAQQLAPLVEQLIGAPLIG